MPCAAQAFTQLCLLGLQLLVQVCKLLANLGHPAVIRPMLQAQLRHFLLQIAAARANLPKDSGREISIFVFKMRVCGQHQFRIALYRSLVLRLAQNSLGSRSHQFLGQLVHLRHGGEMLSGLLFARIFRRNQNSIFLFKLSNPAVFFISFCLQSSKLRFQPSRSLSGISPARLRLFAHKCGNQCIHHICRDRRIVRAKTNLHQQRAWNRPYVQAALKAFQ